MINLVFAMLLNNATVQPAPPLTPYETRGAYIAACAKYKHDGDPDGIIVAEDGRLLGTIDCEDYAADIVLERPFQAWYARTAKVLGINPNPDDPRHCYDLRAFYRAMMSGDYKSPKRRGDRFPSKFETVCHAKT